MAFCFSVYQIYVYHLTNKNKFISKRFKYSNQELLHKDIKFIEIYEKKVIFVSLFQAINLRFICLLSHSLSPTSFNGLRATKDLTNRKRFRFIVNDKKRRTSLTEKHLLLPSLVIGVEMDEISKC